MPPSGDKPGENKADPPKADGPGRAQEPPFEPGFGPAQLKFMGFTAVILTCALVLYLFLNVHRLETQTARFLICLLVSLLLGVFFFVWWPRQYELDKIPVINLPVRVTGPIVVWLVIFLLLLQLMPREDAPYKAYSLVNAPTRAVQYHREIRVIRKDGREADFELVEDRNQLGQLGKIFVRFNAGEDEIAAELRVPLHKPLPVILRRSESTVDISKLEYSEE